MMDKILKEDTENVYWNGNLDDLTRYSLYFLVGLSVFSLLLTLWNLISMRREYHKSYDDYDQLDFYNIIKCAKDITQAVQTLNLCSILTCTVIGSLEFFKIMDSNRVLESISDKSERCLPEAFNMKPALANYLK